MEILATWLVLAIAVGLFASNYRGRSGFLWFLLAVVTSPLIAIIFALVVSDKRS